MPRIVSLIASASEIVHCLGLTPYQVGRSHECDFPEEIQSLPVCTKPSFPVDGSSAAIDRQVKERLTNALSIYEVFEDVLEHLEPTHIITQTTCKVCAVSLEDVERALGSSSGRRPQVISLEPESLPAIWEDVRRVGRIRGDSSIADAAVAQMQGRMDEIARIARMQPTCPSVACIEWHEPLMAAGNWVPELVEMAHARNLFGQPGRHSPWMTWEDLKRADPDVIVTMPCGFDLARTEAEMYWLRQNPVWSRLKAVRNGQVYLTDGNQYMNRPGPRVVESLRILAEILHPQAFEPSFENTAWRRSPGCPP